MSDYGSGSRSAGFLGWLSSWRGGLGTKGHTEVFDRPDRAAVLSVDMIVGFCTEGPLASPRVAAIIPAVVELFEKAHRAGVEQFVLFQDTHSDGAPEFDAFGPHAIAGSRESETIPELTALPFSNRFEVIPKNSLSAVIETSFGDWLAAHQEIDRFVIVGDCTDLCVYQLAMHLKLSANARNIARSVIVPASCVDTYDMPVDSAAGLGVLPHDAELLHTLFLYHMALNGIEVVAGIE
jgi:nicotinamidase-related amidase